MSNSSAVTVTNLEPGERYRVAGGLELIGRADGSGLLHETFLVRRADGQVAQVSALLDLILRRLVADKDLATVASEVSERHDRDLTPEALHYLLSTKLIPLGLVEVVDAPARTSLPVAAPILSLAFRWTLIPATVSNALGKALRPLFYPPVVIAAVVAFIVTDIAVIRQGSFSAAVSEVLATPTLLLGIYLVMTSTSVLHELGHAAGCKYGGATPGRIGAGIYLVFLAFYTDVTDSYRLGRAGKLRTDLGGLYFNALTIAAMSGAYLGTGNGFFLLIVLLMHIELVQQLIPIVRFDGYYVLSDLIGVPDLFARIGPVLRSALPGRPPDPQVLDLRPITRRIVTAWVVVVVPTLIVGLCWLMWRLPMIVQTAVLSGQRQAVQAVDAWQSGAFVVVALSVISTALLVLPLLGIGILFWRLFNAVLRLRRGASST